MVPQLSTAPVQPIALVKPVTSAATLAANISIAASFIKASPLLKVAHYRRTDSEVITRPPSDDIDRRLAFLQSRRNRDDTSSPTTQASSSMTYLVGFGRAVVPRCPIPNPNHQWA
jgi:hypothetical protein